MPYYCKRDNRCVWGHMVNNQRVFYEYVSDGEECANGEKFFETLWNQVGIRNRDIRISKYSSGRSTSSQVKCVQDVLFHYCKLCKSKLNLQNNIEAVVAIWTEHKKLRQTFYSCNKGANPPHRHAYYDMGLVGALQKLCISDNSSALFYDLLWENGEKYRYINNKRDPYSLVEEKIQKQPLTRDRSGLIILLSSGRSENLHRR